jgi:hypothetical protein
MTSMKNLRTDMNDKFINKIFNRKAEYHKKGASLSFEEKFKIIINMQKIDYEMRKNGPRKRINKKMLWSVR